jgi:excisionase family DNA binding protein
MGLQTKQQVAAMLNISVSTLNYWVAKGYGPRLIRLGRLVRFKESDVKEFIDLLSKEQDDGNDIGQV